MKTLKISFLILLVQFCFGQNKKFTILNKSTNLPIENVNLTYLGLNQGTFTNADGTASLDLKKNDLKISMIGYEDKSITYDQAIKTDTLHLIPIAIELNEVTVNSFNLKSAINYVLDNYSKLYVDEPFEKECNFKETLLVDNDIKRLVVSKINWWDKSYERKKSDLKLRLGGIAYNKSNPLGIYTDVPRLNKNSDGASADTNSIINTLYLNSFLKSILYFTDGGTNYVINSTNDIIAVHFETEWKKIGKSSEQQQLVGTIMFDKKTKAILMMSYDVIHKNSIEKVLIKESNKESINETTNSSMNFKFDISISNKFSLKSYESSTYINVTYDNKTYHTIIENKIYVLKESATKSVDNDGLIDLTKPIFKSLPATTISSTNSILLSEKELKFINSKN